MTSKREIWDDWISRNVKGDHVQLFETDENLEVKTEKFGRKEKVTVLKRSEEMEDLFKREAKKVRDDVNNNRSNYEGIIYMMYHLEDGEVIPLYIGKTGRYKEDKTEPNSNLKNYGRWHYNEAKHIGKLSATVLKDKNSKKEWAEALFEKEDENFTPELKEEVYLWIKAWEDENEGPYNGEDTYLAELEYQLIGLAYPLYSKRLLNSDGVATNPEAFADMKDWPKK